jgi:hypothetical protein
MSMPATLDTGHVQVMRTIGPPQTCYVCAHADCERRRRETRVPCGLCEARILPGEQYRVLVHIGGEVVAQVHERCRLAEASRV